MPVPPDDRPYDYDFLIVIPAAASELERRNAVRNSWAKYASSPHCDVCRRYKVHMVFVVGNEGNVTESRREAAEKGDMGVLEHFGQEKYFTMQSRKTLLSIKYAVQHFTFRYVLKCDTDSWVYIDRLLDFFEAKKLWNKPILYAGNFEVGTGALANQQEGSKWYDPIYPAITGFTAYPRHAKGAGYVLSRMLAEALANEPDDYWEELTCEDVSVGFWLSAVRNEKVEIPVSLDPVWENGFVGPLHLSRHHGRPVADLRANWLPLLLRAYASRWPCRHPDTHLARHGQVTTRGQPEEGVGFLSSPLQIRSIVASDHEVVPPLLLCRTLPMAPPRPLRRDVNFATQPLTQVISRCVFSLFLPARTALRSAVAFKFLSRC